MIVKVTRRDIKNGHLKDEKSCPIALALRRLSFKGCKVDGYDWSFGNAEAKLPKSARNFVEAFDNGKPVKPFSFRTRNLKKVR